jgi:hypothetical protein
VPLKLGDLLDQNSGPITDTKMDGCQVKQIFRIPRKQIKSVSVSSTKKDWLTSTRFHSIDYLINPTSTFRA